MNVPAGKGLFLWQPWKHLAGDPAAITQAAVDMGLSMVSLKVGSGAYAYPFPSANYDLRPLRDALGDAGILVFGWHYVYGSNSPSTEARIAGERIAALDLDGYEIDAEGHYKNYPNAKALELVRRFKEHTSAKDIPLGLTTYRYPDYHPEFPWLGFLADIDYCVPQVYWQPPPSSPTVELARSIQQWDARFEQYSYTKKPYYPAGRVYIGDGYPSPGPPASEIVSFIEYARDNGLPGCTFWSFDNLYTHAGGSARKDAISSVPWETGPPPPTVWDVLADHEERITVLENQL